MGIAQWRLMKPTDTVAITSASRTVSSSSADIGMSRNADCR